MRSSSWGRDDETTAQHYVGRAVVRQKDGQAIMLETHERGLRSAEEIAAFEGKLVRVVAAHTEDHCLGWGNGTQAAIVGRCVRGIVEISLVHHHAGPRRN